MHKRGQHEMVKAEENCAKESLEIFEIKGSVSLSSRVWSLQIWSSLFELLRFLLISQFQSLCVQLPFILAPLSYLPSHIIPNEFKKNMVVCNF